MDTVYQHVLMDTLLQTRRHRQNYYLYFFYGFMGVVVVIGAFLFIHYWKIYAPRIKQKQRYDHEKIIIFRNTMRKHIANDPFRR